MDGFGLQYCSTFPFCLVSFPDASVPIGGTGLRSRLWGSPPELRHAPFAVGGLTLIRPTVAPAPTHAKLFKGLLAEGPVNYIVQVTASASGA